MPQSEKTCGNKIFIAGEKSQEKCMEFFFCRSGKGRGISWLIWEIGKYMKCQGQVRDLKISGLGQSSENTLIYSRKKNMLSVKIFHARKFYFRLDLLLIKRICSYELLLMKRICSYVSKFFSLRVNF